MQAFLKRVFRKDIVAITQNVANLIAGCIRDIRLYGIVTEIGKRIAWFGNIVKEVNNLNVWLNKEYEKLKRKLYRTIFGARLSTPLIIYQPGKVGSITVHESLKTAFEKLDLITPIHHAHNLNYIDTIEESIREARKDPAPSLKKLEESRLLRQEIDADQFQKWNIVSLVRDPVALRASTMFQVLDEYIPDWLELTKENKLSIQDLQHLLLSRKEFDPEYLATWFNKQVKNLFGFDVFASPFNIKQGFKIYRSPLSRFSFMVIRLEDLDRVAHKAFYDFIRLKDFQVINQNIGDEKPYSQLYKQFKATPLPGEYLDTAYKTQYARHFYTPQELETFRNRWLHPEIKKGH
jgi:hypothetical protein